MNDLRLNVHLMKTTIRERITTLLLGTMALGAGVAQGAEPVDVDYEATLITTAGSGDFAPYYLNANRHGLLTQSANALLDIKAEKAPDLSRRFSWAFGVEAVGGWSEATAYERYTPETGWTEHDLKPAAVRLQQLYGMVKWRGVFLSAGMREHESALLNFRLSSGDLVESGNARPLPEVRMGFIDFQDIPFTNGWVQIQGEVSYGKFQDNKWVREHYNHYNYHYTQGSWLNYKRCYFRTKPSQPLSVTVGAQCSNVFAGRSYYYNHGEHTSTQHFSGHFRDFIEAFLPVNSREDFRLGNSLGSWDLKARYRLRGGAKLSAYFQWPWEDGSGLGRRNGWDGLWGIEYEAPTRGWLDGAVVEYLDFTNQSGPLHWATGDRPGTTITGDATGADDYYNNVYYNSYANYGLSIGTPFMKAPLFNTDGYPAYTGNRLRGFHIAAQGHPTDATYWRAAVSYRKAWGNGMTILKKPQHDFSMMIEGSYRIGAVEGLLVGGAVAVDRGNMFGNNFGVEITVKYAGLLKVKK